MENQNRKEEVNAALLDKSEAATYLRTTERHVEHLARTRVLGHSRVGRSRMFSKVDLDSYLARNRVEPEGGES